MKLNRFLRLLPLLAGSGALIALSCGGNETPAATPQVIVQTVIVEKPVAQTVIVEKPVQQTVLVEKPVAQTVVVEKTVVTVVTATPIQPATPTPVPAAKAAPPSKQKAGEIIWTVANLGSVAGGFNARAIAAGPSISVGESLFKTTKDDASSLALATAWTMAPDGKSVTVNIRKGVQFHQNYGEMTAEDVAWSYNDANPSTSVKYGSGIPSVSDSGGSWAGLLGANPVVKVDDNTITITFANFDPLWNVWYFGSDGLSAGVVSKKAFDKMGVDWNNDHEVATGPFELTTFVRGDRAIYQAVAQHWRVVPKVKQITQVVVPDETVRQAMMLSGEADIAVISLGNVPSMQRNGMGAVSNGNSQIYSVWFTGNLWEPNPPTTGAKLDIGSYVADQPWLGNPYTPNDSNNPAGMDDMEQARLVRTALAMALDRDLINQKVVSGLGWAEYLPYFDWHAKEWQAKWNIKTDLAAANAMLDQAGYKKDANGTRFTMPFYGFEFSRTVPAGVADAAAGMWQQLGIKVDVLHYDYTVFRPSIVGRTAVIPWVDYDGSGSLSNHPWDWPRGNQASALSRGGKSHAVELPQATSAFLSAGKEIDRDKRIAINNDFADFLNKYQVGIATIAAGNFLVINPNKIAEWKMEPGIRQVWNTPENIVLK